MYGSNGREKNPADRLRRNAETYVIDHVEWDGKLHGPVLPKARDWCDETRSWWKDWRQSPQAMLMTSTDWNFMLDTALLHDQLWSGTSANGKRNGSVSDVQLASEIRQRVAKFGATYEDRKKLRMSIDTPQTVANRSRDVEDDAEDIVGYLDDLKARVAEKQTATWVNDAK